MNDLSKALAALFRNDPDMVADPYQVWTRLRDIGGIYRHESTILVSSYSGVRTILADAQHFSGRWAFVGSFIDDFRKQLTETETRAFETFLNFEANFMRHNDDPEHARLRRSVQRAFGPRPIASMRSKIREHVDVLLKANQAMASFDFAGFAYQLPLRVMCDMLEIPERDESLVHQWSGRVAAGLQIQSADKFTLACQAFEQFRHYLQHTLERIKEESDDSSRLMADLRQAQVSGVLDEEAIAAICINVLFAGHETSANLISIGLFELLNQPDQWSRLVEGKNSIPNAVEELLRFVSPTQWEKRVALVDWHVDGTEIPANTTIFPIIAAANRDPSVFDNPDRINIDRENASEHLAFGFGIHHCLGAALARLEGEVVFDEIRSRFPDMHLGNSAPTWEGIGGLRRIASFPVSAGSPS